MFDRFAALDADLRRWPGHKLFTVLVIDRDRHENKRVYTSEPRAYPCGGAKPLRRDTEFFRKVIGRGESRICYTSAECRYAFDDHELIAELGCASAVNVPIRRDGFTLGSLNLLHEAGWYTPEMIPALEKFAAVAADMLQPNATQ